MDSIFTFEKLYKAYLDCRKNKANTETHKEFFCKLEENLLSLLKELKAGRYYPGTSICFVVTVPVVREVFAASFRDRIVHHLLINEIEVYFEKHFIYDSFSCRKGKGTLKAVSRLRGGMRSIKRKSGSSTWYLQLDISSFFMSIDKQILFNILKSKLNKIASRNNKSKNWLSEVLMLCEIIVFHSPVRDYKVRGDFSSFKLLPAHKSLFFIKSGKGLPIGNLTSQFFANVYLNELDQFIKRDLKIKVYRYVDDFILLNTDKGRLLEARKKIEDFLKNNLDLKLNSKKTKLQKGNKGIDFIGFIIREDYFLVRNKTKKKIKFLIEKNGEIFKQKEMDYLNLCSINKSMNSYFALLKSANCFRLLRIIKNNK